MILCFLIIFWIVMVSLPAIGAQNQITFWTIEMEQDRLEIQRKIAHAFTKKTGIYVRVIPVQENLLAERVASAYAAGSLPDVIFHPIAFTIGWAEAGILDDQSATDVVNYLGKETFGVRPLALAHVPNGYAAVPTDGWVQLLLYRKDLFKKSGLPVPNSWNHILQAAQVLHDPPLIWGFAIATDPEQIYTQQIFEQFALSNGVRLTSPTGNVDLNTPEMVQTLEFYSALFHFTPSGNFDWRHTRMDYVSGRTSMIIWSPFILDELSGLRKDLPVVPDIAMGEPGYLARNTGFVSTIHGPKGAALYGQINCLGITRDAKKKPAKQWVKFLLTDGYLKWLSMAPEGKLPMRKGTRREPNRFTDGWMELEIGVTTRVKISEFYGVDVVQTIVNGVDGIDRWGFTEKKGTLVSKIYQTKVIPKIVKRFLDGELSAKQAARMMDKQVKALE
jgi:multiple sugar transport system substrate-binding protein